MPDNTAVVDANDLKDGTEEPEAQTHPSVHPSDLDPAVRPWLRPDDLISLRLAGSRKTIYAAIKKNQIPSTRIGRKLLVPTWWVRREMQLDEPQPVEPKA
jgi:hypothetical protein